MPPTTAAGLVEPLLFAGRGGQKGAVGILQFKENEVRVRGRQGARRPSEPGAAPGGRMDMLMKFKSTDLKLPIREHRDDKQSLLGPRVSISHTLPS